MVLRSSYVHASLVLWRTYTLDVESLDHRRLGTCLELKASATIEGTTQYLTARASPPDRTTDGNK